MDRRNIKENNQTDRNGKWEKARWELLRDNEQEYAVPDCLTVLGSH